jgi:lipid-A-disaccharide synthase
MYAARLAKALQARLNVKIFGMGGPQMRAAGVEIIADSSEVAVVGITEILGHLPAALRAMNRLVSEADRRKPALAVLTDFPDFHLRLACKLLSRGVRNVYFICPQFWAWRPWRVRLIRERFVKALCIFPFEEKFFRNAGVPTEFIGHPLVGAVSATQSREQFCAAQGLDPGGKIVTVLPGSRAGELAHHLPVLQRACAIVHEKLPAQFVVAAAHAQNVTRLQAGWAAELRVRVVEGETYNALAAADAAIVSSGTATVEAALLDAPMVVIYKVSALTAALAGLLVRTRSFAMVNLIAQRAVVPELVQRRFSLERVAAETLRLLEDANAREKLRQGLAEVRSRLGPPGAIERAADHIAALLGPGTGNAS